MDFSQTKLYIVASGNTLPTTGSTQNLTAGQFGIFRQDYSVATAGNVGSAKYIFVDQGRNVTLPGVGTNRSANILAPRVKEWYKVTAETNINVEIINITDFSAKCSEDVTISLRVRSFYANTAFFNGLTKSYTITTPCCECGDDPCDNVDTEDLIDQFVAKINADIFVNKFLLAEKVNSGSGFYLRLTGKQVAAERTVSDPSAYPYQYDVYRIDAWAYRGPEISQDYIVYDSCEPFATVTIAQLPTYPSGSSKEILQLEKNYWSYSVPPIAKQLFRWDIYNGGYVSQVVDGTFYDTYYIKFDSDEDGAWSDVVKMDNIVIIAVPTTTNAGIQTILEAYLGTVTDETGADISTTTTSSTTVAP